ncbi:MAG: hypothetical protein A2Y66_02200 [Nitrospirae bacterium RBG_13_41_22]|nr:MAG: hypothetical protein A2Y66_02200 [Nitrospirae bacterium RBG_13_41_22]
MTLNGSTSGNAKITHPVRVLQLIEHLKVGGAERLVFDLVQTLDKDKVLSIICLYRKIGTFGADLKLAGYQVVFLHKDILSDRLPMFLLFLRPILFPFESLIFIFRLAHLMCTYKIQLVHSHMFSANMWGRISALLVPHVSIITTEHTTSRQDKTFKHLIINRILSPFSDKIVAVSQAVADHIVKEQKTPAEKVIVIPNGIRINFDVESADKRLGSSEENLPASRPRIAIIGRLVPVKRHDLLLKALNLCAERLPNFSCSIIGDGPEKPSLEKLVQKLHLTGKVFFLGERTDVRELLYNVDLVVNTSDREGLSMSLLEAMAAGKPVVATDIEGNREIIQPGETGILVEAGNVHSIAHGICRIIENPGLAKYIGQKGLDMVRNLYDMNKISRMWEKLYEKTLNEQNKH